MQSPRSFVMFRSFFENVVSRVGKLLFSYPARKSCGTIYRALIFLVTLTFLAYASDEVNAGVNCREVQLGYCTLTNADGSTYSGNWESGKKDGSGSLITHDSIVYSGLWQDDELVVGDIQYPDGSQYFGSISGLKPHGDGIVLYSSGPFTKYEGNFKEGKYFGKGTLYQRSPNGWIWDTAYEGLFEDGKRHGLVLTRDDRGVVIAREMWQDDAPVSELQQLGV